jgi:hypothetical protein
MVKRVRRSVMLKTAQYLVHKLELVTTGRNKIRAHEGCTDKHLIDIILKSILLITKDDQISKIHQKVIDNVVAWKEEEKKRSVMYQRFTKASLEKAFNAGVNWQKKYVKGNSKVLKPNFNTFFTKTYKKPISK